MEHTSSRAAGGLYCGDSKDMQELVKVGFMASAGKKSFVPDEYFKLTNKGRAALGALSEPRTEGKERGR
jgi:hypothetical protein